ncbi:ATP-binding protein [bacterium]|nr:ATP-binding protein [bacterium]
MDKSLTQEFKLLKISLLVTFLAALSVWPLEAFFVPVEKRFLIYGVILFSLVYSVALFLNIRQKKCQLCAYIFILCHLAADSVAVVVHAPQYLMATFVITYTFIIIFNVILVAWPAVAILDALIFIAALGIVYIPQSGFLKSLESQGLDASFTISAILIYFAMIIILGTGMIVVKRRTENQLRDLNLTLNKRVKEKIEEYKQANLAARQSQVQLESILRNIPVGVVIIDESLKLLYSNGVHFRFAFLAGTLKEQPGSELPLEMLTEQFIRPKAAMLLEKGEDLIGLRMEYTTLEGTKKIIRYSYVCVKLTDEPGDITRLVLITEDITREENIRNKLVQTNHLAGMGKMAASLVHEVNNPLTGIKLNLELLEYGLARPDKREQVFYALSEGVTRIDRIIKSFLSFARQDQPKKQTVDIHAVLQETLTMAVNFKQFHRVHIETFFAKDIPKISADRYRLEQVFINLLNNSCDAMAQKDGYLKIITSVKENKIVVKFEDNGIGIKKEDLQNIFTPFFTTKERGHGTGLGLATSYGIVNEHGGSVEVESREGVGTIFTILLPVQEGET